MTSPARIMIVDDNDEILQDFRQILDRRDRVARRASLDELERAFTGGAPAAAAPLQPTYELCLLHQGEQAVRATAEARAADQPFACAFVDIRMPPGIGGIETVARIWQMCPDLEVVLCSAYSDYSWEDIAQRLDPGDRLLVLRKPFDPMEVRQLAACLTEKWRRGRALADRLRDLEVQVQCEVEARLRERTRHDEERRRSQRLGTLGQLAAGIAHEINTPTQYASASLEYVSEVVPVLSEAFETYRGCLRGIASGELTAPQALARADQVELADALDELPRAVSDARSGIARISQTVRSVRSHAHLRDAECLVPVDVNAQVHAALELARHEYKHDADAVVELGDVPHVMGDPGDLCLAIVNLVVNAAHAMHDKRVAGGGRGRLTVTTRCTGERVEIAVADTGGGIPEAVRDRVFEPFFTTKPVGQGTGQGLSIAHATIVERHRGTLRFETEVGVGTTFLIGLPVVWETP
ncbi:MAG TPA: hybrid sensor histidine kinase/response regulator [Kofleriaceae bacterium]|nr:hybrid sensor histidine kinase/response regulator [Kofleriaceae bacterium]